MSKKIKVVPDLSLLLMTALVASTASINSTWAETEENQQHLMTSDDIPARGDSEDKLKLKADDSHAHSKESTASRAKNAEKEASHVKSSSASKIVPDPNAILDTEEGKRAQEDAAKIRKNFEDRGIEPGKAQVIRYESVKDKYGVSIKDKNGKEVLEAKMVDSPDYARHEKLYPIPDTERKAQAEDVRVKRKILSELKKNNGPKIVGNSDAEHAASSMNKKPSKITQLKNKIKDKLSGKKPVNADSDAKVKEAAEKKARQSKIDDLHAKGNEQRKQNINKEALDNNKKMMRAEADAKNVAKAKQASEAAKATEKSIAQVAGNEAEQVAEKTSGTVGKAAGVAGKSESKLSKFGGFLGRLLK